MPLERPDALWWWSGCFSPDRLPRGERTKPLGGLRQWGMQRPKGGAGRSPKWGVQGGSMPQ